MARPEIDADYISNPVFKGITPWEVDKMTIFTDQICIAAIVE